MKILFDNQAFDMQIHGGVSRCFAELYAHRVLGMDVTIGVLETDNVYLKELGFHETGYTYKNFLWGGHSTLKKVLYKYKYNELKNWDRTPRLNHYYSGQELKSGNYDIYHPTFFDTDLLRFKGKTPLVITVHDMIPEQYPQFYDHTNKQLSDKQRILPLADHIVAVSENTKQDIIRLCKIPENKISVIYHGASEETYIPGENIFFNSEYILYVGDRHLYKNFYKFVKGIHGSLLRHKDLKVVCTGQPFNENEELVLSAFNIRDRFEHVFAKNTQDILDLYHYAVCFVYPSEYEGFGIPILEAYKADCPVILNNASCFPEIAGDAATYINLCNGENDLEDKLEMIYHLDAHEREAILQKQRERLKMYTWSESAKNLMNVYNKIV